MTTCQRDIAIVAVILSGALHALTCAILYTVGLSLHGSELSELLFHITNTTLQLVLVVLLAHAIFGWKRKRGL